MRKIYLLLASVMFSLSSMASVGGLIWQKCYGGTGNDSARSVSNTADGGFYVAGVTYSNDGNVTGNHNPTGNFSDVWIIKVDATGNLVWQKTFGGVNADQANSIATTTDGGAVICGWTNSSDGDASGLHGSAGGAADFWVIKLDNTGALQWQKTLGGTKNDYGQSVKQTADGGYIVAGTTYSNDGDVTGNHDASGATADFWVVKLDNTGAITWQKTLGGTLQEEGYSITQTTDLGYMVAGVAFSHDGNVSRTFNTSGTDAETWFVKLDASGTFVWQSAVGGSNADGAYSVVQAKDGSYAAAGYTNSKDQNVSGNHDASGNTSDEWIVDVNSTGSMTWQNCYGGSLNDVGHSIKQMTTGHFFVTGNVFSVNGNVTNGHDLSGSTQDLWTYELNSAGYLQWENSFGGSANDGGYDATETADSNFVEVGHTSSNDGNVTGNHGGYDFWIIKVQSKEGAPFTTLGIENVANGDDQLNVYPNPAHNYATVMVNDNMIGQWIELTDMTGRVINEQQITTGKFTMQTTGLANGVYLLRAGANGTGALVKKLVIN